MNKTRQVRHVSLFLQRCSPCTVPWGHSRYRRLRSKRYTFSIYVLKITVDPRHEQISFVVIGEVTTWESVPQGKSLWKEAVLMELTSHQGGCEGGDRGMTGLDYDG